MVEICKYYPNSLAQGTLMVDNVIFLVDAGRVFLLKFFDINQIRPVPLAVFAHDMGEVCNFLSVKPTRIGMRLGMQILRMSTLHGCTVLNGPTKPLVLAQAATVRHHDTVIACHNVDQYKGKTKEDSQTVYLANVSVALMLETLNVLKFCPTRIFEINVVRMGLFAFVKFPNLGRFFKDWVHFLCSACLCPPPCLELRTVERIMSREVCMVAAPATLMSPMTTGVCSVLRFVGCTTVLHDDWENESLKITSATNPAFGQVVETPHFSPLAFDGRPLEVMEDKSFMGRTGRDGFVSILKILRRVGGDDLVCNIKNYVNKGMFHEAVTAFVWFKWYRETNQKTRGTHNVLYEEPLV